VIEFAVTNLALSLRAVRYGHGRCWTAQWTNVTDSRRHRPLVPFEEILLDNDVSTWIPQKQTSRAAASGLDQGCPMCNI